MSKAFTPRRKSDALHLESDKEDSSAQQKDATDSNELDVEESKAAKTVKPKAKRSASGKKERPKTAGTAEEKKKSTAKKVKKEKEVDKTGDHPPPKRPPSAWGYFNSEFTKKWNKEGNIRTEAFAAAAK